MFLALLFAVTGLGLLAFYLQWIDIWQLDYIFSTYWPIVLIIIGIAILWDEYRHRRKLEKKETQVNESKD